MTLSREKKIWLFALGVSMLFHALFFVFGVNFQQRERKTPIVVKLVEKSASAGLLQGGAETVNRKENKPQEKAAAPQILHTASEKTKVNSREEEHPQSAVHGENEKQNAESHSNGNGSENSGSGGADVADKNSRGSTGNGVSGVHGTGNAAGEVVDVNALVITKKIPPQYPAFSRKRKEEGTVHLLITISENSVTECKIEKSSGYARLDEAAKRAVIQWKFSHNGNVCARVPVVFKISD